jgi:hypothetical protein
VCSPHLPSPPDDHHENFFVFFIKTVENAEENASIWLVKKDDLREVN